MKRTILISLSTAFVLCIATFEFRTYSKSSESFDSIPIMGTHVPVLPLVFSIQPGAISEFLSPEVNQLMEDILDEIGFTTEAQELPLRSKPLHFPELELIELLSVPMTIVSDQMILKVKETIQPKPVPVAVEPLPTPVFTPAPAVLVSDTFWPVPRRVALSHVDGVGEQSGISFGSDYSTLQFLLAPDYKMGSAIYLIDIQGHRFDNNSYATSLGVGGRYLPQKNSFCEVLGLNAYYDWRQGFIGNYHQVGIGLEVLGKRWDLRANGYIPLGSAKNLNQCSWDYPGGYEISSSDCEFATYGFNAELGFLAVRGKNFLLYTATGPYFLSRSTCCFEPMRGFEFRLRPQYRDYLALEGRVSWDTVYKWVYQTEIILSLPLYQITHNKRRKRPCGISERQVYQTVERFEVMPLGRKQCWQQNF